MLILNLNPVLKVRGIKKPYTFLVNAGITPYSVNSMLKKKGHVVDLRHLELLCKVLLCEPQDILEWRPGTDEKYAEDFPLAKLKHQFADDRLDDTFSKMNFKELKEVKKIIAEKMKKKEL